MTHLTGPHAAVDARILPLLVERGYHVTDEVRVFLGHLLVFSRSPTGVRSAAAGR